MIIANIHGELEHEGNANKTRCLSFARQSCNCAIVHKQRSAILSQAIGMRARMRNVCWHLA